MYNDKINKSSSNRNAKARVKCLETQKNGTCNEHIYECENCTYCYEQGTRDEQLTSLKMLLKLLENKGE